MAVYSNWLTPKTKGATWQGTPQVGAGPQSWAPRPQGDPWGMRDQWAGANPAGAGPQGVNTGINQRPTWTGGVPGGMRPTNRSASTDPTAPSPGEGYSWIPGVGTSLQPRAPVADPGPWQSTGFQPNRPDTPPDVWAQNPGSWQRSAPPPPPEEKPPYVAPPQTGPMPGASVSGDPYAALNWGEFTNRQNGGFDRWVGANQQFIQTPAGQQVIGHMQQLRRDYDEAMRRPPGAEQNARLAGIRQRFENTRARIQNNSTNPNAFNPIGAGGVAPGIVQQPSQAPHRPGQKPPQKPVKKPPPKPAYRQ